MVARQHKVAAVGQRWSAPQSDVGGYPISVLGFTQKKETQSIYKSVGGTELSLANDQLYSNQSSPPFYALLPWWRICILFDRLIGCTHTHARAHWVSQALHRRRRIVVGKGESAFTWWYMREEKEEKRRRKKRWEISFVTFRQSSFRLEPDVVQDHCGNCENATTLRTPSASISSNASSVSGCAYRKAVYALCGADSGCLTSRILHISSPWCSVHFRIGEPPINSYCAWTSGVRRLAMNSPRYLEFLFIIYIFVRTCQVLRYGCKNLSLFKSMGRQQTHTTARVRLAGTRHLQR